MEEKIKKFLSINYDYNNSISNGYDISYNSGSIDNSYFNYGTGFGNSDGTGSGNGIGVCYNDSIGFGFGYGGGSGCVDGKGFGYSKRSVNGIKEYNNHKVYIIDDIPTIIITIHNNYAKGYIINSDLVLYPCFIVKVGNYFAHGKTLKEALNDAIIKYNQNKPIKERINDFIKIYPSLDSIAEHKELYYWHNILTSSCEYGRNQFCNEHNLDKDNGTMSIKDFIELTKNVYGGDIIEQLAKEYNYDE